MKLITVATYTYPHEMAISKSKLEAYGIECFVRDELTVQVNNFYSNAIGGVKLEVKENEADIVFDFEAPLATNKVLNTIKFNIGSNNNLILSPNPTSDYTEISLEFNHYRYSDPTGITALQIFSVTGTIINGIDYEILEQSIKMDCNSLSAGAYVVVIQDDEKGRFTGRLIVK